MRGYRWILRIGLGLILVFLFIFASLPWLLDTEYVESKFIKQLEQALGKPLHVTEARLAIFPSPSVELFDVTISQHSSAEPLFRAQRIAVHLQLFPLLYQEFIFDHLEVEQPLINILRTREGQWNVVFSEEQDPSEEGSFANVPIIRHISLTKGTVRFDDNFPSERKHMYQVDDIGLTLTTDDQTSSSSLQLFGKLAEGLSHISLDGIIDWSAVQPESSKENIKEGKGVRFTGHSKVKNLPIRHLGKWFDLGPTHQGVEGFLTVDSLLELSPGSSGYDLLVPSSTVQLGNLTVEANSQLTGLFVDTDPALSLTLASTPVRLQEFFSHVPKSWLPTTVESALNTFEVQGVVQVNTASVTGPLDGKTALSVTGEFKVAEAQLVLPGHRTPVKNMTGQILLLSESITFMNWNADYESSHLHLPEVIVTFGQDTPRLAATVDGRFTAHDLVRLMRDYETTSLQQDVTRSWIGIQGSTSLTMKIEGILYDSPDIKVVSGQLLVKDFGFSSHDWPVPVKNVHAQFVMSSSQSIEIKSFHGRYGDSRVAAKGVISMSPSPFLKNVRIKAEVSGDDVNAMLGQKGKPPLRARGILNLDAQLNGQFSAPQFAIRVGMDDAQLTIPDLLDKPKEIPGTLKARGRLTPSHMLFVDKLQLSLPSFFIQGTGKFLTVTPFGVNAMMRMGPIRFEQMPEGMLLAGGRLRGGTGSLTIRVEGAGSDWTKWKVEGSAHLFRGTLALKGLNEPLTDVSFNVGLQDDVVEANFFHFRMGDSDASLSGFIRDWKHDPKLSASVQSSNFDVEKFMPLFSQSSASEESSIADWIQFNGDVLIRSGTYSAIPFTNLRGSIALEKGMLTVEEFGVNVKNGRMKANAIVPFTHDRPGNATASFEVLEIPADVISRLMGIEQERVKGRLSLKGKVTGNGKNPSEVINMLNGHLDLSIQQGRFLTTSVLAKVVTILNLPSLLKGKVDMQEGIPFEKVSATFTFHDGMVSSDNFLVDSEVGKFTGAGTYSLPDNQLDVVMAVSPFGAYSDLLKSIPLFKHIMAGERQGLTTSLFEIKGPLEEPDVTYKPLDSAMAVLKGKAGLAVDILKNIVTLPNEVLSPSEQEKQPHAPSP